MRRGRAISAKRNLSNGHHLDICLQLKRISRSIYSKVIVIISVLNLVTLLDVYFNYRSNVNKMNTLILTDQCNIVFARALQKLSTHALIKELG